MPEHLNLLSRLNPEQREAVETTEGPLLILAGAGSGKTRVLTHRIARLLERGAHPARILAITFTNKAAREMRERVDALVGPAAKSLWVSTFHAACVRILRRDIEKIGYHSGFVIYDTSEQQTLVKECLKDLNLNDKHFPPNTVLSRISSGKNELIGPSDFMRRFRDYFSDQVAEVYKLYQARLQKNNALDFDDIIMKTVELLRNSPETREYYQDKFQYILVDEYQDTNHAQYALVSLLADKWRNLCVVGDDDQSIYSFRSADIRNILEFEKDFPDARVIRLERNYRSTQNILSAAHAVVRNNLGRKDKRLWTDQGEGEKLVVHEAAHEHEEAWFICSEIERLRAAAGRKLRDFAVLYRTNAMSRVLEEVFLRRQLPYAIVGGLKFYDRKEIRDILSYLRLLVNPNDLSAFVRVANVPRRGIGPATVEKVVSAAREDGLSVIEAVRRVSQPGLSGGASRGIGQTAAAKLRLLAQTLEELSRQAEFLSVFEVLEQVFEQTGYLRELAAEGTIEAQTRIENLKELQSVAREFDQAEKLDGEETGLAGFLTGVALVADTDSFRDETDAVVFMTLHSAKGLEFPVVFMVGMEEGIFPHVRSLTDQNQLEEERRLCYVGITRARAKLYLTRAAQRTLYGQPVYNQASRFLVELPPELVDSGDAFGRSEVRASAGGRTANPSSVSRPATRPAVPAGPRPSDNVAAGDRIRHAKWGEGTVVSVAGQGEEAEIALAFPAPIGVKKVVAKYAGLQKLG